MAVFIEKKSRRPELSLFWRLKGILAREEGRVGSGVGAVRAHSWGLVRLSCTPVTLLHGVVLLEGTKWCVVVGRLRQVPLVGALAASS